VPRRLLPCLAASVLVAVLGASGCADEVSPAARIADVTVTDDELLAEVEAWASSPSLLTELQVDVPGGAAAGSYDMEFVDFVLYNRINFELHDAQFEELGLELDEGLRQEVEAGFLGQSSAAALAELGDYGDVLVDDVARQIAVQEAMGDEYQGWFADAGRSDIEVSPRYGRWDEAVGFVVSPDGPRPAPADDAGS